MTIDESASPPRPNDTTDVSSSGRAGNASAASSGWLRRRGIDVGLRATLRSRLRPALRGAGPRLSRRRSWCPGARRGVRHRHLRPHGRPRRRPGGKGRRHRPLAAAVEAARRIDVTSTVEWRNWEDAPSPLRGRHLRRRGVPALAAPLQRPRRRCSRTCGRVLAPGGRLGIMTWGPIEENPAFAAELDAIIKSGLDQSGVVEVLLDAFAYHRIEDLRALVQQGGIHRRVVSNRPDAGRAAPGRRSGSACTRRCRRCPGRGVTAANRPASSSCPGPPSCCAPSSTTGCCGCRPRRASSSPEHRLPEHRLPLHRLRDSSPCPGDRAGEA